MDRLLILVILLLLYSLHSQGEGFTSHSHSQFMVDTVHNQFMHFSSMDAHEKRDLDALLAFRKAITSDPGGFLSNWTEENSENICSSWFGITCSHHTKRVFEIELDECNLTGEIPASIGSMSKLRLLNLSWNQLEGQFPASLSGISTLEQLDLANNNLSGPIPQDLSKISMLASFDVSSNNLCGSIPRGTQFSTFNVTSFQKNKCLCGFPLPPCKQKDKPKNTTIGGRNVKGGWLSYVDEKMSLIALELGMGIGFGAVVAMFIAWDKARHWVLGVPYNNRRRPFYGLYRFPT